MSKVEESFNVSSDEGMNPGLKAEIQGLRGLIWKNLPDLNPRFEMAQCIDAPQVLIMDKETGNISDPIGLCNLRGAIEALNWISEEPSLYLGTRDILNQRIPKDVQGIVYICQYLGPRMAGDNMIPAKLNVHKALYFYTVWEAMQAYAGIPNPASQIATKEKDKTFEESLEALHKRMKNQDWINELEGYL